MADYSHANPEPPQVGDELPIFERQVGFANWNRFAAVNDEFVPIHMNDEAGQAAGYPGAFGMGNLQLSYLHCLLRDWLDDHGRIREIDVRYRRPALQGSINRACGKVTSVETAGGQIILQLDVWVEDHKREKLTTGSAVVEWHGGPQ